MVKIKQEDIHDICFNISKNIILPKYQNLKEEDIKYKNYLINKYSAQDNVIFKGKVPHKNLPSVLKDYSFHINSTNKGFYDKSVLETLSAGLFNFYSNPDYNKHFNSTVTPICYFSHTEESLIQKLNTVFDKNKDCLLYTSPSPRDCT